MVKDLKRNGLLTGQTLTKRNKLRKRPPLLPIIALCGIALFVTWWLWTSRKATSELSPDTELTTKEMLEETQASVTPGQADEDAKAFQKSIEEENEAMPELNTDGTPVRARFGPRDPTKHIEIHIASGETLFQALLRGGLPKNEANQVVYALKEQVDFSRLRVGDYFEGILWLDEELVEGTFRHGLVERWEIKRNGNRLIAHNRPLEILRVTDVVSGVVETNLFDAIYKVGEEPALIMAFINLFRWEFDFNVGTKPGDQFDMLMQKEFVQDKFIGYGPILAARYQTTEGNFEACWYESTSSNNVSGYFKPSGKATKAAFLRSPVEFTRISSGFSLNRLHPVLNIRRPHRGIDYAAPLGTPVYTIGDGTVINAGWMGGAGKAVRIKHFNGWISSYSHLSTFFVRSGERVRQGQLIGRVGSSGHSTGPHLDFRISINGQFVNPLKLNFPEGDPIPAAEGARFREVCNQNLVKLDQAIAKKSP